MRSLGIWATGVGTGPQPSTGRRDGRCLAGVGRTCQARVSQSGTCVPTGTLVPHACVPAVYGPVAEKRFPAKESNRMWGNGALLGQTPRSMPEVRTFPRKMSLRLAGKRFPASARPAPTCAKAPLGHLAAAPVSLLHPLHELLNHRTVALREFHMRAVRARQQLPSCAWDVVVDQLLLHGGRFVRDAARDEHRRLDPP